MQYVKVFLIRYGISEKIDFTKLVANTKDKNGNVPLINAIERGWKWSELQKAFVSNMPAIKKLDIVTGLAPFMLVAIGPRRDLESIHHLLNESPGTVQWYMFI